MAIFINILSLICEALNDVEKLPAQLIVAGSVLAATALKLVITKAPPRDDDVFLHRREAPLQLKLYYSTLIPVVMFGLVEAFAGVWLITVTGGLMTSRQAAIGKAILEISIFPFIVVAGLGGFA